MVEHSAMEKILKVLRPYAANWSGSLGRGDLVIPQREIPRLIHDILDAVHDAAEQGREVTESEMFHALSRARRLPSIQDQAVQLQRCFRVLKR